MDVPDPGSPQGDGLGNLIASRKTMNKLAKAIDDFEYGPAPYLDHHAADSG